MQQLRIRVLGSFEITSEDGHPIALDGRKSQELLAYLLLRPGLVAARETATEAVWPDADPLTGRKHVRHALWQIHRAVDTPAEPHRLVIAEGDHLAINGRRAAWCDAVDFATGVGRDGAVVATGADERLERSLRTYGGPLLDGCYSEWCLIERERLETTYLLALDDASVAAERRGDLRTAVTWGRRLLCIDPAHERTHRRLMKLYAEMGDRTRALRQFDTCREALRDELDLEPSTRTIDLAEAIRADRPMVGDVPADTRSADTTPATSSRDSANGSAQSSETITRTHILRELSSLEHAIDELRRTVERLA